jgi:CBS domain-containing protein
VIPGPGLLFGLLLGAAIVAGYLARMVRVPRVVGYLLAGAAVNALLHSLLDAAPGSETYQELAASVKPLKALKDLALGLILFSIGSVFETRHIRSVGRRVIRISLAESVLVFILVFVATGSVALFTRGDAGFATVTAYALLLGLAAIATAPAATLFVLREYDAKGPMTDTILTLTALNNIICIVLFHTGFQLLVRAGVLETVSARPVSVWAALLLTTLGSVVVGIVLGFVLSVLHSKLPLAETILIFFATFIMLGAGEEWLSDRCGISYNFLLSAVFLGAVFNNIAIDPASLHSAVQTIGAPVFVGFFALAGYKLRPEDLPHIGAVGVAYVVARTAGKVVGCLGGRRWAGDSEHVKKFLGWGLLCQAAVVIGLADFIAGHWAHALARDFEIVVLGSVVIFELSGPLLVKWTVRRSGEVKAVTLLRRPRAPAVEGESITRLTLRSLARTLGLGGRPADRDPATLQVKHIMRTNVKFIRAGATLDDVLHFVEQSRYSHFPVVDDQTHLVGVIHFADIRDMIYDPLMRDLVTAVDLADPATPAVPTDMPLTDLLQVFHDANLGSLPVVEKAGSRRAVGVVEQRDLLRVLHRPRDPR